MFVCVHGHVIRPQTECGDSNHIVYLYPHTPGYGVKTDRIVGGGEGGTGRREGENQVKKKKKKRKRFFLSLDFKFFSFYICHLTRHLILTQKVSN